MQDSEFLSANKMFEAKCKLYTKEMNPKPTHKSSIAAGDMLKLRGYFSEGLDSNSSWAEEGDETVKREGHWVASCSTRVRGIL